MSTTLTDEEKKEYRRRFEKKLDKEDWQYLKNRFIGGINKNGTIYFPDKAELLREWNENNPDKALSDNYFYRVTIKEEWTKTRDLVKRKFEGKKNIDELRAIISQSADFETEALTAIKNLYKLINTSIVQKYRDILEDTIDYTTEEETQVNSKEILDLVNCIPKLIKSTKDILGNEDDINILEEMRLIEEDNTNEVKDLSELERELRELTETVKSKHKRVII